MKYELCQPPCTCLLSIWRIYFKVMDVNRKRKPQPRHTAYIIHDGLQRSEKGDIEVKRPCSAKSVGFVCEACNAAEFSGLLQMVFKA